jgi:hypothetical protein
LNGNGVELGRFQNAAWLSRTCSIALGVFLVVIAWMRYKRDPLAEFDFGSDQTGNRVFDFDEEPLDQKELELIRDDAEERLAKHRKWMLFSFAAFFASCVLVWPFLAGNPLHRYWDSFGVFLLSVVLFLFIFCGAALIWAMNSWSYARAMRTFYREQVNKPGSFRERNNSGR